MAEPSTTEPIVERLAPSFSTFATAIVAASQLFANTRPWWRGQRDAQWTLQPSLYRRGLEKKEHNLNARFRMMARVRREACPDNADPMGWLFLMQHYRLPTRLLDWSQSPLVALFFALEAPDDSDAIVWALSPTLLNLAEARTPSICMPASSTLGRLPFQAFLPEKLPRDERVLAVLTEESDIRHMVQQSAFTIHGRSNSLESRPDASQFLMRIRVPGVAKEALRELLTLLGINRATLFPDLENLALELARLDFVDPTPVTDLIKDAPVAS